MNTRSISEAIVKKWEPVLDGIKSEYMAKVTAQLLENQAKAFLLDNDSLNEEALTPGSTTVGKLGTFQKWAFPLIRRVMPDLIFNKIGATQPMDGPVSQVFYLGHSRAGSNNGTYASQTVYSQYKMTYMGLVASAIGSMGRSPEVVMTAGGDPVSAWFGPPFSAGTGLSGGPRAFDLSNVLVGSRGGVSTTMGGRIASFPDPQTTLGWTVSGGEQLRLSAIPELTFHIQQQAVVARTRKMRALWTIEASQDLKAYHNIDLERELTDLLSKEISLEIDRELIEDIRMIAYGFDANGANPLGGWYLQTLINGNPNSFGNIFGREPNNATVGSIPGAFNYDFSTGLAAESASVGGIGSNVYVYDFTYNATQFAPQHLGHRYSNLLALINFASNDIYKTTFRSPGTVLVTSPLVAAMLESAAKLEGGIERQDGPSNSDGKTIQYVGRFAGKYELIIDPMFPEDEILVCRNGSDAMDTGFVYCPYIPMQPIPTVVDPESFQPRKGILTRYGKLAITPQARHYRIIRLVGTGADFLTNNIFRNSAIQGTSTTLY